MSFKDIVRYVKSEIRRSANVNGRRRLAAWSGPNVIRDIVNFQHALRQSRSNLAIVIDDVVPHIKRREGRTAVIVTQSRIARDVMRPKIVMPGDRSVRARELAVTMISLGMFTVIKTFGDQTPLDGDVRDVSGQ